MDAKNNVDLGDTARRSSATTSRSASISDGRRPASGVASRDGSDPKNANAYYLMAYALGRTLDYHDMPTVRRIVRDAAADHNHFSAILLGIVASPAFQMKQIPASPGAGQPDVKVTQVSVPH